MTLSNSSEIEKQPSDDAKSGSSANESSGPETADLAARSAHRLPPFAAPLDKEEEAIDNAPVGEDSETFYQNQEELRQQIVQQYLSGDGLSLLAVEGAARQASTDSAAKLASTSDLSQLRSIYSEAVEAEGTLENDFTRLLSQLQQTGPQATPKIFSGRSEVDSLDSVFGNLSRSDNPSKLEIGGSNFLKRFVKSGMEIVNQLDEAYKEAGEVKGSFRGHASPFQILNGLKVTAALQMGENGASVESYTPLALAMVPYVAIGESLFNLFNERALAKGYNINQPDLKNKIVFKIAYDAAKRLINSEIETKVLSSSRGNEALADLEDFAEVPAATLEVAKRNADPKVKEIIPIDREGEALNDEGAQEKNDQLEIKRTIDQTLHTEISRAMFLMLHHTLKPTEDIGHADTIDAGNENQLDYIDTAAKTELLRNLVPNFFASRIPKDGAYIGVKATAARNIRITPGFADANERRNIVNDLEYSLRHLQPTSEMPSQEYQRIEKIKVARNLLLLCFGPELTVERVEAEFHKPWQKMEPLFKEIFLPEIIEFKLTNSSSTWLSAIRQYNKGLPVEMNSFFEDKATDQNITFEKSDGRKDLYPQLRLPVFDHGEGPQVPQRLRDLQRIVYLIQGDEQEPKDEQEKKLIEADGEAIWKHLTTAKQQEDKDDKEQIPESSIFGPDSPRPSVQYDIIFRAAGLKREIADIKSFAAAGADTATDREVTAEDLFLAVNDLFADKDKLSPLIAGSSQTEKIKEVLDGVVGSNISKFLRNYLQKHDKVEGDGKSTTTPSEASDNVFGIPPRNLLAMLQYEAAAIRRRDQADSTYVNELTQKIKIISPPTDKEKSDSATDDESADKISFLSPFPAVATILDFMDRYGDSDKLPVPLERSVGGRSKEGIIAGMDFMEFETSTREFEGAKAGKDYFDSLLKFSIGACDNDRYSDVTRRESLRGYLKGVNYYFLNKHGSDHRDFIAMNAIAIAEYDGTGVRGDEPSPSQTNRVKSWTRRLMGRLSPETTQRINVKAITQAIEDDLIETIEGHSSGVVRSASDQENSPSVELYDAVKLSHDYGYAGILRSITDFDKETGDFSPSISSETFDRFKLEIDRSCLSALTRNSAINLVSDTISENEFATALLTAKDEQEFASLIRDRVKEQPILGDLEALVLQFDPSDSESKKEFATSLLGATLAEDYKHDAHKLKADHPAAKLEIKSLPRKRVADQVDSAKNAKRLFGRLNVFINSRLNSDFRVALEEDERAEKAKKAQEAVNSKSAEQDTTTNEPKSNDIPSDASGKPITEQEEAARAKELKPFIDFAGTLAPLQSKALYFLAGAKLAQDLKEMNYLQAARDLSSMEGAFKGDLRVHDIVYAFVEKTHQEANHYMGYLQDHRII